MPNNNEKCKFKLVDDLVSGDFVFDAYGESLNELFANCATACFYAMTESARVNSVSDYKIELLGENLEELLFNFLSELIYLKDAERIFCSKFVIDIDIDKNSLSAVVWGEKINYERHTIKTDVKAVTYYGLKIINENDRYTVRVILDI